MNHCKTELFHFCTRCVTIVEPYKDLVECEFQVERLFSKYKLEDGVDVPLKAYLLKMQKMLDKVYESGKEMVSY